MMEALQAGGAEVLKKGKRQEARPTRSCPAWQGAQAGGEEAYERFLAPALGISEGVRPRAKQLAP